MRQHERYRFREGYTPLSAKELNDRFFALDGRLHQLELLKISWESAIAELQNHGLERVNSVIDPLLDQARGLVEQVQLDFDVITAEWENILLTGWQGILDGWAGVRAELDAMQADIDGSQAAAHAYTDSQTIFAKRLLCSWFAPSPDSHPYLPENQSVQGQDIINLPATAEAWAGLRFDQTDANANQNLELRYWMATSDTQPINFGLAMAKGRGPLADTPWQPSHTYSIGDKIIPSRPNGCEYEMIGGGSIGISAGAGSEPTWGTALNSTVVDNEIIWKCVRSGGGYDQVADITGRSVTANAFTPASLNFQLPGDGIPTGERINLLAIRKVDPTQFYWTNDICIGGTAIASNEAVGYEATNAFDDNNATLWNGILQNTAAIGVEWIGYEWPSAKSVDRIEFLNGDAVNGYHKVGSVIVQYWGGSSWISSQIFDGLITSVGTPSWETLVLDTPINASKVRLLCNGSPVGSGATWRVCEILMFDYVANPGSGHQGDMHILDAYVQGQEA